MRHRPGASLPRPLRGSCPFSRRVCSGRSARAVRGAGAGRARAGRRRSGHGDRDRPGTVPAARSAIFARPISLCPWTASPSPSTPSWSSPGRPPVQPRRRRRCAAPVEAEAPAPAQPRPVETAIIVDEGSAYPFDRRDVYDELSRFLDQAGSRSAPLSRREGHDQRPDHRVPVDGRRGSRAQGARAPSGSSESPRSSHGRRSTSRSREDGSSPRSSSCSPAFSGTSRPARVPSRHRRNPSRQAGGPGRIRFEHSARLVRPVEAGMGRPSEVRRPNKARQAFELWSRAVSSRLADTLTATDLTAKALERDIVLIPIAAVAIDRRSRSRHGHEEPAPFRRLTAGS